MGRDKIYAWARLTAQGFYADYAGRKKDKIYAGARLIAPVRRIIYPVVFDFSRINKKCVSKNM